MTLTKTPNKTLYCLLALFSFFAFISPLSITFLVVLCVLVLISPILLDDNQLLCFWIFTSCFMSCFKFQTVFLAVLDGAMFIFIVKILLQRIKQKQNINFAYLLFGFFIICFIYSCIVNGNAYKISQSLGIVLTIIVLFLIKNISVKNVTLYVCFGLIISSILFLYLLILYAF